MPHGRTGDDEDDDAAFAPPMPGRVSGVHREDCPLRPPVSRHSVPLPPPAVASSTAAASTSGVAIDQEARDAAAKAQAASGGRHARASMPVASSPSCNVAMVAQDEAIKQAARKQQNSVPGAVPGAVAVAGMNDDASDEAFSFGPPEESYGYDGLDSKPEATSIQETSSLKTNAPLPEAAVTAKLVDDDDLEAQVQARVREETEDIAARVQRHMLDHAVMADVMEPEDPNKAPPVEESFCTKRKWILTLMVALVVLLGIGAALGVLLGGDDDPPPPDAPIIPTDPTTELPTTEPPTSPPTGPIDIMRDLLEQEFPDAPFDDPNSPQFRALEWLAVTDELQLTEDTATFRQIVERYVIALLYFSTNGDQWLNKYLFLSGAPVCSWNDGTTGFSRQGVFCDSRGEESDDVTNIFLNKNNLVGVLPTELTSVEGLVNIELRENSLGGTIPNSISRLRLLEVYDLLESSMSGTIPSAFFELPRLEKLSLDENEVTGTIPQNVGNARRLRELWLQDCTNVEGSIPESLTQIDTLEYLVLENILLSGTIPAFTSPNLVAIGLSGNILTGTIPSTLGSLPDLQYLLLSNNALRGTLPDLAGDRSLQFVYLQQNRLSGNIERIFSTTTAPELQHVVIYENELTGTIPTNIGRYTDLVNLQLDKNEFRGNIPTEIGFLTKLEEIVDLRDNQLGGTIPTELGRWTKLSVLDIGINQLVGRVPSELGRLQRLEALRFALNQLTGTVPTELAALPSLEDFYVAGNDFSGSLDPFFCTRSDLIDNFWADCLGTPPEIECSCCTTCCSDVSNQCEEV